MSYIGRGTESISNVEVLDNLTFNGSASYTLQKSSTNFVPSSANNLLISISGVVQQGNFSVSGSTITFDTTVSGSDTCDWILHYGTGLITTVADGAITETKLGSNAVTNAKITDGTIANAKLVNSSITLNGSAVSLGGSASVANTPSFYAYLSSNISSFTANQYNTIVFGTEGHDSNSDYDTSTGIFTPSVAGKYFCFAAAKMGNFGDGAGSKYVTLAFFWNGTSTQAGHTNIEANGETTVTVANVIEFNGTTDNIRVRGYQNDGAGTRFVVGGSGNGTAGNYTWFGAYRLIGV